MVYGRRLIEAFDKHWPQGVVLHVYHEGNRPELDRERVKWIPLDDDADRRDFMARFQDPKERIWDYTKGIVKYSHKVWAMSSVNTDADALIWMDGDTETLQPITPEYLDSLLPKNAIVSYLHRPYFHTETGLVVFRLDEWGRNFLRDLRQVYISGVIAKLPAQHDCAAFDFMRNKYEDAEFKFHNLCPGAKGLAVFEQSPLKGYIAHNKGTGGRHRAYGTRMGEMV